MTCKLSSTSMLPLLSRTAHLSGPYHMLNARKCWGMQCSQHTCEQQVRGWLLHWQTSEMCIVNSSDEACANRPGMHAIRLQSQIRGGSCMCVSMHMCARTRTHACCCGRAHIRMRVSICRRACGTCVHLAFRAYGCGSVCACACVCLQACTHAQSSCSVAGTVLVRAREEAAHAAFHSAATTSAATSASTALPSP